MSPLWLLKYLPNMPASHVAIYNDLRGPNNSLTLREAAANVGRGRGLSRSSAAAVPTPCWSGPPARGCTAMKIMHAMQQEEVAVGNGDPAAVSRPFDRNRSGMVLGEGAGAIVHRGACPRPRPAARRSMAK